MRNALPTMGSGALITANFTLETMETKSFSTAELKELSSQNSIPSEISTLDNSFYKKIKQVTLLRPSNYIS